MPIVVKQNKIVKTPRLIDLDFKTANNICELRGLELFIDSEIEDKSKPDGVIIRQQPESGKTVKKGKTIIAVINQINAKIEVPYLKNKSIRIAKLELQQLGFEKIFVSYIYNNEIGSGKIISTDPAFGKRTYRKAINILVSKGKFQENPLKQTLKDDELKEGRKEF